MKLAQLFEARSKWITFDLKRAREITQAFLKARNSQHRSGVWERNFEFGGVEWRYTGGSGTESFQDILTYKSGINEVSFYLYPQKLVYKINVSSRGMGSNYPGRGVYFINPKEYLKREHYGVTKEEVTKNLFNTLIELFDDKRFALVNHFNEDVQAAKQVYGSIDASKLASKDVVIKKLIARYEEAHPNDLKHLIEAARSIGIDLHSASIEGEVWDNHAKGKLMGAVRRADDIPTVAKEIEKIRQQGHELPKTMKLLRDKNLGMKYFHHILDTDHPTKEQVVKIILSILKSEASRTHSDDYDYQKIKRLIQVARDAGLGSHELDAIEKSNEAHSKQQS